MRTKLCNSSRFTTTKKQARIKSQEIYNKNSLSSKTRKTRKTLKTLKTLKTQDKKYPTRKLAARITRK